MTVAPEVQALIPNLELLPLAAMITDCGGTVSWANSHCVQIAGYSVDELLGQNAVMLEPDRSAVAHRLHDVLHHVVSTGEPWGGRVVWRHRNGELHDLDLTITAIRDASGRTTHSLWMALAVQDRETAEQLQRCKVQLDFLNNHVPNPYQSLDAEGCLLDVNEAWLRTLGYSREEVIGRWFGEFLAPDQADLFRERFPRFKQAGWVRNVEFTMVKRDGSQIGTLFDGNIGRDVDGQFLRTHCVWRDDTEHRRAVMALRESEARLRTILQAAMDGFWLADTQGRLLEVNEAYCRMSGYTAHDLLSMSISDLDANETADDTTARIHKIMTLGEHRFESRQRRKDGSVFDVEVGVQYRPTDGGRLVAFIRDITERKRAEAELLESREVLQAVLNAIPVRVFWKDRKLVYLGCNMPFARDAGCERPEEIVGKDDHALSWREQADLYRAGDHAVIESGVPRLQFEEVQTTPQGELIHLLTSKLPLRDASGAVVGVLGTYYDVTDRVRAREELRESEARHRTILQTAMDGFWLADTQGRLLEVNEAYCRMSGYSAQELLTMSVSNLEVLETADDVATRIQRIIALGENRFESQHRRKDGSVFDVEVSIQYRPADGGQCVTFVRDITERRRAEETLRGTEARHARMISSIGDVLVIIDQDGINQYESPNIERFFGWKPEDVVGSPALENVHPEDVEAMRRFLSTLLRGTNPAGRAECRYRCKDGSYKWIEFTGVNLLRDPDIRGVLGNYQDITERRRAETELRENERLLRESQGAAHIGSYVTDLSTRTWKASPEMYRIFGIDETYPHTLDGWGGFIHPDSRADLFEYHLQVEAQKKRFDHEYKVVRINDGEIRWVHGLGELEFDSEGHPIRLMGTIQDITERKSLEARFHQAQKLESIGRLAGGVAHDFNNLLTVINGYTEMMLGDLAQSDSRRSSLKEILKAGERAASLTQQLLAYSRKQILEQRPLDLNRVVREMRSMLQRLVGEDVEVCIALNAKAAMVHADPHQLDQVVMNLAVNSRDAMPKGGKLLIETANVELDETFVQANPWARAGHYVTLAVSDTGVGMDEQTQRNIFEPFFTTKGVGKGTGLGLSMVQGIVAQSGGNITVYSEPGQGTTFRIYLPRLEEETADGGAPKANPVVGGTETVLAVEDQPGVLRYAADALSSFGYRVLQAENSREALQVFKREGAQIDLVLTDVIMPNGSGRELADQIERLRPGIKILFMSGYTDEAIAHHGVLETGAEFIQKPFSPWQLAAKVRMVLGQKE